MSSQTLRSKDSDQTLEAFDCGAAGIFNKTGGKELAKPEEFPHLAGEY